MQNLSQLLMEWYKNWDCSTTGFSWFHSSCHKTGTSFQKLSWICRMTYVFPSFVCGSCQDNHKLGLSVFLANTWHYLQRDETQLALISKQLRINFTFHYILIRSSTRLKTKQKKTYFSSHLFQIIFWANASECFQRFETL